MSTESIPAASANLYRLVEDKIYRGDELVATLQEDGSLDYAPDMARYRAPVVRFMKSLDGVALPNGDEAKEPVIDSPVEEPDPKEETELTLAQIKRMWPKDAPACDWRGDLTPEFVDWFYENYPDEAVRRYEGRFTHRNFEEREAAAREEAHSGVI